jgi:hypothetical protein
MDDFFKIFLTKFGSPFYRDEAPASSITRYREKLPDLLLEYWEEHGWGGYADGLFWIVNPQEYESIVKEWVEQSPVIVEDTYHVIARNAFGDLHLWGERTECFLTIDSCWARYSHMASDLSRDMKIRSFFAILDPDHCDPQELFHPAMRRLGRLRRDEMYGFVPALALGGSAQARSLEIVKTVEHLLFLSQLEPLRQFVSKDPR